MESQNATRTGFIFFYITVFILYSLSNFVDRFSLFYLYSYAYIYKFSVYLMWLFIAILSFNIKISARMNIFICILLFYMFFDIKVGAVAFVTYFLPVIATFFFFSNFINSKNEINFVITCLGVFFVLSVFYAAFNEVFGYADFEIAAFNLLGNLFDSGEVRIRSFFVGEQTLYIHGLSIVILSFIFANKYRYIFLFAFIVLLCFYIPKNPAMFMCIFVLMLFVVRVNFSPVLFHIYFIVNILIFYYFAKITYFSGIVSLHGTVLGYTPFGVPSVITRYEIWDQVASFLFANPFGYGLGTASYVLGSVKIIAPHSEYLKTLLELGILGFCIFYIFLYHMVKTACFLYAKTKNNILLYFVAYLFAFVFISFFNDHFFGNAEKLFFWMFAGLVYNFNSKALKTLMLNIR
ncbi:hypothetical protein [Campylobacter mucosalis]|uniref:hypothetical protein n=1 Tax=Campylobacter mucosalis TaxID=202 RepID=UPI0014707FCE|nr:hypothetical protein [Campylobacter mucosalis]